jgi:hypothetical protein
MVGTAPGASTPGPAIGEPDRRHDDAATHVPCLLPRSAPIDRIDRADAPQGSPKPIERRMLARSLLVGAATILVSYLAGEVLL